MDSPVSSKLKISQEEDLLLLNIPPAIAPVFGDLTYSAAPTTGAKYSAILLFVSSQAQLQQFASTVLASSAPGAKLWIAYPKKSSSIKADIDRDRGWNDLITAGYRAVAAVSIDETWSALRFRPEAEINRKSTRINNSNTASQRTEKQIIEVPAYLQDLFRSYPAAKAFFNSLCYTHRKEYVHWITEAKKPETRERRLEKMLEMLQNEQKSRY